MPKGGAIENERLLFSLLGISSQNLVLDSIYIMSVKLVRKFPNDVLPFSSFSNIPFTSEG